MGEIIYEKTYPKEGFEDMLRPQDESDNGAGAEHRMPATEQFFRQLEANYTCVLLPASQKPAAAFVQTAIEVSELYQLDIKITRHIGHISVNYYFASAAGMRYLLEAVRLADNISFFTDINGYELVLSLDYYTHAVFYKGRQLYP